MTLLRSHIEAMDVKKVIKYRVPGIAVLEIPARTIEEPRFLVIGKIVDEGKSVFKHLDLTKAKRPNQEQKRVNKDAVCIVGWPLPFGE
ncbi:MAG: hypothetical protein RQ739_16430 [Desulfotignum sp.]|nr:hypothetical protein [Desulfotignum sp.]